MLGMMWQQLTKTLLHFCLKASSESHTVNSVLQSLGVTLKHYNSIKHSPTQVLNQYVRGSQTLSPCLKASEILQYSTHYLKVSE